MSQKVGPRRRPTFGPILRTFILFHQGELRLQKDPTVATES
jgi:hypothetical protein